MLLSILLHKANFIVFVSILFIYCFGGHYWQNILFLETPWRKTTNEREFPGVVLRGSNFAAVIDPFPIVLVVQRMVVIFGNDSLRAIHIPFFQIITTTIITIVFETIPVLIIIPMTIAASLLG